MQALQASMPAAFDALHRRQVQRSVATIVKPNHGPLFAETSRSGRAGLQRLAWRAYVVPGAAPAEPLSAVETACATTE